MSAGAAPSAERVNRDLLRRRTRLERLGWTGLTLPALTLVVLILVVPVGWLFWTSAFNAAGAPTLDNYARLLRPAYLDSLATTVEIAAAVTLGCVVLGYPVAYLLVQLPPRASQILMLGVVLPFWTSVLVRTYAWLALLQRNGVINAALIRFGVVDHPLPLVNNMFGTIVGMTHVMLPFFILPLYASMKAIDPLLLRAAANCGASPAQTFRQVFLPLSASGLASGIGLTFVLGLGYYLTPALLGGGKVAMWSMQIASAIAIYGNWGVASALGVALLAVTAALLLLLRVAFRILGLAETR